MSTTIVSFRSGKIQRLGKLQTSGFKALFLLILISIVGNLFCSRWLNLVERWFGELSSQCIRRGVFFSVKDLKKTIGEFLDAWNENPQPFCLDRYRGSDHGKAISLSANVGEDSTRLHPATEQKEKQ